MKEKERDDQIDLIVRRKNNKQKERNIETERRERINSQFE
jgi:hypothetical protein